tara:strand:- start:2168 stop:2776 length:609 start_codon:yes stop_codon:yes gene_type:complete
LDKTEGNYQPILLVISGPSGVGKDSVIQHLKANIINCHITITATTRDIRPGEIDGKDYIFLDKVSFVEKIRLDQFLEYAQVYGNWYGIPTKQVTDALSGGSDVIIKADVQGASTIKNKVEGSILIFLKPPSTLDLEKRLRKRHTEDEGELHLRLATAKEELSKIDLFDYIVVNDNVAEASEQIKHIIDTERFNQHRTKVKIL